MTKAQSLGSLLYAASVVIALSAAHPGRALAQCPPTFAAATYWSVGSPYSVGVGDFNNDGRPDIVAANFSGSNATVRLASAVTPGAYDGPINFSLGLNPRGCAVADFNHDGIADIAVVYNGGGPANTKLAIIISNGNGTFQAPVLYATASQPFDVKVADFNHDNNPDVAVVCGCGTISVHLGNADGTFQPYTSHAAGSNASGLAVADFTGDGTLDMYIPSYGGQNIRGAVGLTGAPTFGALLTHSNGGYFGPWQAASGDFNEDGRADAVVTFRLTNRVAVQLSNTDGTMTALAGPFAGNQPQDVACADFNGDGHLDVAVANWGQSNVSVHLGDGTGALGAATYYAVAANPNGIVVADMNSDGKPDIVVACQTAGNIAVLLNTSPTFAFTQHPQTRRVCPGGTSGASFTAAATTSVAGGITAYRWERLVGSTWTTLTNGTLAGVGDVSGATLQTLAVANVQGQPGDLVARLRCVATNSCGTLPSNPAELRIIRPCGGADVGGVGGVYTGCGDGVLDNNDFVVFIDLFFNGNVLADVGSQGGVPGADGQFNNNDFVVFIDMFFSGCTM